MMVDGKKIIKIGEEGDYDVFYDEESGDVWFSVRFDGEDYRMCGEEEEW